MKKNNNNFYTNKPAFSFLMFIAIIIFAFSTYKIIIWFIQNRNVKNINDELQSSISNNSETDDPTLINPPEDKSSQYWSFINTQLMNANFESLLKENNDTVGWLKVENTNVNYPVVQADDNDYYLNHDFLRHNNEAGWVFADYRNNMRNFNQNTIIYGHSRLDQTIFGSLRNITKIQWLQNTNNHVIHLSTPTKNTLWQVFSVYKISSESYYLTSNFSTDAEYSTFLNTLSSRSIYKFNVDLNTNDKILTLSTCTDSLQDGRIVLHAKLIKSELKTSL